MTAETYAENDLLREYPGLWEWLNAGPIHEYAVVRNLQLRVAALECSAATGSETEDIQVIPDPQVEAEEIRNYLLNQLLNPFGIPGGGINPAG